jgi:hypothetical protein
LLLVPAYCDLLERLDRGVAGFLGGFEAALGVWARSFSSWVRSCCWPRSAALCALWAAIEVYCLSRGAFVGELALERRAVVAGVFLGSVRSTRWPAAWARCSALVARSSPSWASLSLRSTSVAAWTQPHDTPVRADPRELALARFALPAVRLSLSGLAPRTSGDRVVTEIRCSSASSFLPMPSHGRRCCSFRFHEQPTLGRVRLKFLRDACPFSTGPTNG